MKRPNFGIWTRLLLAFGAISATTIVAVLTAIWLFEHSNDLFTTITDTHLPEVIQAAEFADIGARIIAMAPGLVTAPDTQTRDQISNDLKLLLQRINNRARTLKVESDQQRRDIGLLLKKLKSNLKALKQTVAGRLVLEQRMASHTQRLRWLYADLLDEIEPLNQDLAYNLDSEIERLIGASLEGDIRFSVSRLRSSRLAKEAAEKIGDNGVMLVSLILQAPTATGDDQVAELQTLAADTMALLRVTLATLPDQATTLSLRQILSEVFAMASGDDSVFSLRRKMFSANSASEKILSDNRDHVSRLRQIMDRAVERSRANVFSAVTRADRNFDQTRIILALMALLSLLTAAAVLWFYVRGNIVARLDKLRLGMQAIADGDLSYRLPPIEDDEIGKMTSALTVFRDTAQAVEDAHAQTIIDNTNAGLIIASPAGNILFINSMAARLFNIEAEKIIGQPLSALIVPREHSKLMAIFRECVATDRTRFRNATFQGICHQGPRFPVDIAVRPVRRRDRQRLIITLHDATERVMAQELLQKRVKQKTEHLSRINLRLRQEVKERKRIQNDLVQAGKLAALGQLSAGITHELNQPLSAIGHYSHNARRFLERGQPETARNNLEKISELTERMAKIINHLKSFARKPTNRLVPVNLARSVERTLSLLAPRIEKNRVAVHFDSSAADRTVMAEDVRLEQVLLNIIGNAIDAVGNVPEAERRISITTDADQATATLAVSDSGPGIPAELLNTVFDPFYTTKEVGKGLGLGLSISYNIVKDFGGQLTARTGPDGGSAFVVTLRKATDNA